MCVVENGVILLHFGRKEYLCYTVYTYDNDKQFIPFIDSSCLNSEVQDLYFYVDKTQNTLTLQLIIEIYTTYNIYLPA